MTVPVRVTAAPGFPPALGMACCQHDYRVRFVTAAELVTLLVEAQQQGRLARKLAQLARFDLVICDELGYGQSEKKTPHWRASYRTCVVTPPPACSPLYHRVASRTSQPTPGCPAS